MANIAMGILCGALVAGGIWFLRDGDSFGWFPLLIGVLILAARGIGTTNPEWLHKGKPEAEIPKARSYRFALAAFALTFVAATSALGSVGGGSGSGSGSGGLSERKCASLRLVFLANNNSNETREDALSDYRNGDCERFE